MVYFLLATIVFVGAWLRMQGIVEGSFSYTYDVGRDMLAVKDIVVQKNFTLLGPTTGLEGFFYGPWWYYLLCIPFLLSAGSPTAVALFIALLGTANILVAFVIGRKIGSTFFGIACASIISVSTFFIHASTQIWSPNIVPFLVLLIVLCLRYVFQKESVAYKTWLILGVLVALTAEMEIIFGVLFSIGLFSCFLLFHRKKILQKRFLFFFVGILSIELPRLLFELRNAFLMSKKVLGLSTGSSMSFISSVSRRENFIEIQSSFDKLWSDTIADGHHGVSLILLALLFFVFIAYYRKAQPFEKMLVYMTAIISFVFFLGFALFPGGLWLHYLIGLPVLFVLSSAVSLHLLQKHFPFRYVAYILLFAIVWLSLNPIDLYIQMKQAQWKGDEAVYRNQIKVIDYIYKEADGKQFKYIFYTPPVHDYTYKYLFSWYGAKTYHKEPNDKGAELLFFIVEPDIDYYHRRLDWLAQRDNDGKLVKKERVVGNVVVQTRTLK